jgi:hypothetical protein
MSLIKTFSRFIVALGLLLGFTVAPVAVHEVAAGYLSCTFSPPTRQTSTYGGSICFNSLPGSYPSYARTRITCEYWTMGAPLLWHKYNYTVRSGVVAINSGNWAWAYCQNHYQYQHESGSKGPDWVLHLCVEFDPPGYGTGSGGYICAY